MISEQDKFLSDTPSVLDIESLKIGFVDASSFKSIVEIDSLVVRQGESLGLVGESGSGKTLTALSIMGLLPKRIKLREGRIMLENLDITTVSEKVMQHIRGNKIGMIFQEPAAALDPLFSIRQQLFEAFPHSMLKSEKYTKTINLLYKVGLPSPETIIDSYPHELSGGMKQRVMIAIAIAFHPVLIIADEPTTALDAMLQKQVLYLIKSLVKAEKLALIVITHDLNVVRYICDRIAVMYAGKIVEMSPRDELFDHPKHPYTQLLLSSMLTSKSQHEEELLAIKGEVPDPAHYPAGCRFHPRCPYVMDICKEEPAPSLRNVGDQHTASCHLY